MSEEGTQQGEQSVGTEQVTVADEIDELFTLPKASESEESEEEEGSNEGSEGSKSEEGSSGKAKGSEGRSKGEEKKEEGKKEKKEEKKEGEEEEEEGGEEEEEGAKKTETPEDKTVKQLRAQNAALLKTLRALQSGANLQKKKVEKKDGEGEEGKTEEGKTKEETEVNFLDLDKSIAFIPEDEDEFDALMRDPKKLNEVLNSVVRKAYQLGRTSVMSEIPEIVDKQVKEVTTVNKKADKFYEENEDLIPFQDYIVIIANRVQGEHPEYDIDKLLEEVEREARSTLLIEKKKVKPKAETSSKGGEERRSPAFAGTPSGRKESGKSKLKGLQKEIDDLIN
jgi:hypothetical protein